VLGFLWRARRFVPRSILFFFGRNEGKRETKEKEKRRKKRNEGKRETKEKEKRRKKRNEGKRETKEKVHHSVFVMKQFTQQITPFHTNHNS
jgi:hypothetical protein